MRFTLFASALVGLLSGLAPAIADEMPNLAKVDRTLRKEPLYVSKRPLYGLAAFGPNAEKALWLVLDQSNPASTQYDILYIDLNGDGDLTGASERLTPDSSDGRFRLEEFTDPVLGVKHPGFSLRASGENPEVMLGVSWRGQYRFGGGYPEDPEAGYFHFADRPADAPVLWVYGDAPFRFQRWYGGKLPIGGAEDFKVFLGQPGRGRSAFCATQVHILPEGEWVRATLLYRDQMGKEQRLTCELRERC